MAPYRAPGMDRSGSAMRIAGVTAVVLLLAGAGVTDFLMFNHNSATASAAGTGLTAVPAKPDMTTGLATTAPTKRDTTASTPTPTPTALSEARQIDSMLQQSVNARSGVAPALTDIANCRVSAADTKALRYAAQVRQRLLDTIAVSDLGALPDGEQLRSDLTALWQASINADNSYLNWASSNTCDGSTDPNQTEGDSYSQQATAGKVTFLAEWNPITAMYRLPQRDQSQI